MAEPADILARFVAGDLPANVALMQLAAATPGPAELRRLLQHHRARADAASRSRIEALSSLLAAHPNADALIRSVLDEADHGAAGAGAGIARWAGIFDRLARSAPEAAVALYALGSPDLLAAATAEVVERMRGWALVAPGRSLLEIGCGIGRLALALAPLMGNVTGLDVSGAMVAEARRRGAGCPNATFRRSSGHDLDGVPDASVDTVLAADVFPYLVAAGSEVARRHVVEAARILRPGGGLLILNYSYRGDLAADRAEVAALFAESGFSLERDGTHDLALWDGATFLGRRV